MLCLVLEFGVSFVLEIFDLGIGRMIYFGEVLVGGCVGFYRFSFTISSLRKYGRGGVFS